MSYDEYVNGFLGISREEWDEVAEMFKNYEITEEIVENMAIDSNKYDLISQIIYQIVDPDYEYIDVIDFDGDTIKIYELCDVEDLDWFRDQTRDALRNAPFTFEFIEA